jgi:tetratricopeptide (TPR) repeat protein
MAASVLLGVLARAPDAAADAPVPAGPGRELRLLGLRAVWAAGTCVVVALAALVPGRETAAAAEVRLAAALVGAKDREAVRAAALEAIDAHPADALLPALAGQACARVRAPAEALAFVNRALFLRPLDGPSHRIAARALLELGKREQAFLEYRLAVEAGDAGALREAVPRARTVDELSRLCPDDGAAAEDAVGQVWHAGRAAEAVGLAEVMAERLAARGQAAPMWAGLVNIHLARSDVAGARRALDALEALEPEGARVAMARARYLWATGDRAGAVSVLQAETARAPGDAELAFLLVEQLLAARQPRAARDALARIAPFLSQPAGRARLFAAQGQAFEMEQRFAKALEAYQTASRLQPESAGLHYDVARMHEAHRQPGAAAQEVLAGMRVDTPAGAANAKPWADRLLSEERTQLQEQAEREQKDGDGTVLEQELLEAEVDTEVAP